MSHYQSFLTAPCMLAVCFIGVASAADGVSETGSRVGSAATKLAVLQLNESTVVDEVQRLLDQGKTTDAIALARDYVDSFQSQQSITLTETVPESYFALNALCVALTRNRDYDEAIETCTQAIRIQPRVMQLVAVGIFQHPLGFDDGPGIGVQPHAGDARVAGHQRNAVGVRFAQINRCAPLLADCEREFNGC